MWRAGKEQESTTNTTRFVPPAGVVVVHTGSGKYFARQQSTRLTPIGTHLLMPLAGRGDCVVDHIIHISAIPGTHALRLDHYSNW